MLTWFYTELHEFDEVLKAKKHAASHTEVGIKKLDHRVQALTHHKRQGQSHHGSDEPQEAV